MTKHYGRLLLLPLALTWAMVWAASCIAGEVSFDGGNTLQATANSVWNHKATFREEHDWWPYYMADLDEESLQADPSSTLTRNVPVADHVDLRGRVVRGIDHEGRRLPDSYVVYAIPVLNSLDGSVKLKINTGLFDGTLDPNRTNPNDADPRDPTKPGPYSPLLGVYDNPQCTGTNYWRPGNYSVNTSGYRYGIITIPPELQPEGGWNDWTNLYVKVSTFAVDGVWTRPDEPNDTDPRFPRRVNYFRKPDWMPAVITGTWPGAPTAYSLKPDVDPNKVRMRTVTGVFVPQLMNGTVTDLTHVVPRDPSRVKTVLAVFPLQSMSGTRIDETHVQPENPALISFLAAVYAIDTKPGTPVDATHVVPTDPTVLQGIFRVRRVYVADNPTKDYYDHANPYTPGDTEINLAEPLPDTVSTVQIEFESPDLYETENREINYSQGDPMIALNYSLPEDSTNVRIVYGVGSGLDGPNYYDPNNELTAFHEGDESIILKTPLPAGTTDVRILYGTDSDLEVRGARVTDTSVAPANIWTVARVRALYAIRDYMSGIRKDDTTVEPFDPASIRTVLAVFPAKEMAAQIAEDVWHIKPLDSQPNAFLAIRRVRSVYATDEQTGSAGEADPDGSIRRVVPSVPGIIGRVFRVYANGKDYYDPNNPETTYRTGDPFIKLSTPLDPGVTVLTITYETIDLLTNPDAAFTQGGNRIALDISLPDADPISIRVKYTANGSLYNPVAPVRRFAQGDREIVLNTPLPAGSYEVDIVYTDTVNRYNAASAPPDYAPGESAIPLMAGETLPDDATGAIVQYSAHLFPENYDPMAYDPNNPVPDLRPFIPGDQNIRLNRLDPVVELPQMFRVPGAVKLCLAYQSDRQYHPHEMGTYSVGGTLQLAVPLPYPLPPARDDIYVSYRVLSNYNTTVDPEGKVSFSGGTWTVGRPYMGYVVYHDLLPPPPAHGFSFHPPLPPINSNGRFWGLCMAETPPTPVGPGPRGTVRYRRREPDSPRGVLWITGIGGKYRGRIPMYWDTRVGNPPSVGAVYYVAASAGLNMANPKQQPSNNLEERRSPLRNRLILDPIGNPMWHAPGLVAEGDGTPRKIDSVGVVGYYFDESTGDFVAVSNKQIPTVHDSRSSVWATHWGEMINYGGNSGDRDWLESYPGAGDPDPLVPEPAEEINVAFPDDGSSSTQFVFRVRYKNDDGLPPKPWLRWYDDPWNGHDRATGVVLYLDEKGTGDYQPHFMARENPRDPEAGSIYIYRVLPHHSFAVVGTDDPLYYPWNDLVDTYQSLACGVYHYFFACSDDSLTFDDGSLVFENQLNPSEWGHTFGSTLTSSSTGLDPSLPRAVEGFGEINRPAKRRCDVKAYNYLLPFDSTIYVDRPCLVPGAFHYTGYPLSAHEHPKVTCSLGMPAYDDLNIPYDDAKYGYGRFFGTIYPYARMVNPVFKAPEGSPYDPIYRGHLALAETCGVTSQTEVVLRILYKQIDNKPPIYIRALINNASVKSGTGPDYAYTEYSMEPSPNQTRPYNYRDGVWYQCKLKLPPGPHTYYFQAYDGEHVVRFPVRPDRYEYDDDDTPSYWVDAWVPTQSLASERTIIVDGKSVPNPDYFDNDYFPGPYVNNPPVLSEASVTPGTGKEGQNFRYRIKYQDADGHRPLTGYVYIEVNDRGKVERFAMRPETPFSNPADDHRQDYKDGVYYILDTGTIKDLALENGVRRYYFEFTDDWGPYNNLNDIVPGETTRYPQGAGNWITGPVISGNRAPTLYQGSVTSQDGTANAATLWSYRVFYRDLDNDPPALIRVYIGLLQADGKTVLWDAGHTLEQANPSDKVYSDGAEYYFQTRLGATEASAPGEQKQYFYAFEAYDGVDWATYNSSANDETRSNAAGCMLLDELVRVDGLHYKIRPMIVQQCTVSSSTQVTPTNPADILRVWGVYETEDLTGTNYFDPGTEPQQYAGGPITLTTPLPAGATKAWLQYEPQAPIVGPLPIDLPAPAGVIPDAQIYEDYGSAPTPILIDDQKNGWINTDPNYPDDRATLVMRGVATFDGQPSVKYVTPDSPRDIASVEGVYLSPDLTGENYYDVSELEPPMKRTGRLDPTDPSRMTVIPDDPDRIDLVTGVFDIDDEDMAGTNYYLGAGYPTNVAWQEALLLGADWLFNQSGIYVSGNTVWPTNPYDIVTIRGVYPSMDLTTTNHYRSDGLAAQPCGQSALAVRHIAAADTKSVTGVYLSPQPIGTNYYDTTRPWKPGDLYVNLTAGFTGTTAYVHYIKTDDSAAFASGTVYVMSVQPVDPNPFVESQAGLINGVYKSVTYVTDQEGSKPVGSGTNYAVGVSLTNGVIPLTTPLAVGSFTTLYVVYQNPPFGFGPYGEYIGLSRSVDRTTSRNMFVAYYARGPIETTVDRYGKVTKKFITLSKPLPAGKDRVYIRCIAKAFNCGDTVIPLTKDLPAGTSTVYIKYSDIRFTHQLRGDASEPDSSRTFISTDYWDTGTTHYSPDGWTTGVYDPITGEPIGEPNVHIKNNKTDITGGVIGVWENVQREGKNYFKPQYAARHDDNPLHLRLTSLVPEGTYYLWARYYQKGDYHIDRWNRDVFFLTEKEGTKPIQASYFFGTKMPQTLGPNTPPDLIDGKVNKLRGSRGDVFTYTVIYRDLDGPNGQAPTYVRVYIDGVARDMTPAVSGTPAYREGALFTYTPPEGLAGGSHKFRFEASDGAAVAWFDANGAHQSSGGQAPVTGVVDIDGPWVNNPPELVDGLANPNPTSGGINPWDSVDYTVTYVDVDNDEPYFYDPVRDVYDYDSNKNGIMDGPEFSGSPRLWIDSGAVDEYFTGTVAALEEDLMGQGKKRTIVAAGDPGWTPDKFSGALLQITNGAIAGRVYLIQSNTSNKLIIATDDLEKDGVIAGGDNASTFRINGLLMAKANPTQQDYTQGIQFKITVPKLAVGTHKFHFTARSREYKPQWLVDKLQPFERVPYSGEARWPSTGDQAGPTVVSTPPAGNTAPVVSLTPESQRDDPKDPVFVGPMAQIALATTPTQVEAFYPTLFAQIREVRGVFLNANDFDLTSVASRDEFSRTLYNPKTAQTPFAPGDTKIVLTSQLAPVAEGAQLVQFGNVDSSSLLKITPDASSIIGSVQGVYLTSDPALTGTNYYDQANPFNPGDTVINLAQPLPSGTKQVYVKYTYKSVTAGQLWPAPVYVKYFLRTSSRKFKSSDLVTFRLAYRDADNDPPSYHDNVQGYIRLVFNTTGQGRQMQLLNPPAAGETLDYRANMPFSTDPITLPEGQHKYHFEASDGYYVVRYPAGTLGDPAASDYTITVNYKPVITAGKVEPAIGQTATTFTFTATYKDQDGTAANPPVVTVRITKLDGAPWEEASEMTSTSSSPNYAAGVEYVYSRKNLPPGSYKAVFEATDGDGEDAVPYPAAGQPIIAFTVRDTNETPEILSVAVVPTAGGTNRLFNYTATYRDSDGDAPISKSDGQKDAMTLVIDPGTANEQRYRMTKAPTEPANPDYKTGVKYQTAQAIAGKKLGAGHHTYTVEASDGTADTALLQRGQADPADALLRTVIPDSPNIIGAVVGVYRDLDIRDKINYFVSADGTIRGQFVNGKITLPRSLPSGTRTVYIHYAVAGPVLLIPYFENFRAVDAASPLPELAPAVTQAAVGQEVKFVGSMKFPYNTETTPPAEINDITIQATKPDGTAVSLSASVKGYQEESETLPDGTKRKIAWVGQIQASYPAGVDPSLVTGTSFTLTASGEWTVSVSWPGNSSWDRASNEGQEVKITVGGQMRTVAVTDPSRPDTSTPAVDMITVPNILGSPDVGVVFGYERALEMQIVRWDPSSRTYFRYGTQGWFPDLLPGEAIWIKPRQSYAAESVTQSMLDQGLLALGNPEAPFSDQKKYRLIKAFVKDHVKDPITGQPEPCTIVLRAGWNQFGSIFFNWKRDGSGREIIPKVDVGIPLSELRVRYLGETKFLADAAAAGWVRGYAWRWDAARREYVLVHPAAAGAERVLKAWFGYWIRAFVDCELIVPSTTSYNGETLASPLASTRSLEGAAIEELDTPPPAPE